MNENKNVCWAKISSNSEAIRLFKHNTEFHRSMGRMLDVFGWKVKKAEDTYYYVDGFDIDQVINNRKWHNHKADDPFFHEYIVKSVILPAKRINLLDWLKASYPQRSQDWFNEVEDGVAFFIKHNSYKIRKIGDWFGVFS